MQYDKDILILLRNLSNDSLHFDGLNILSAYE